MHEEFSLKTALERLNEAMLCGNNPFCKQNGDYRKDKDACFGCVLFDLKEYSEELHGSAIVGEPYGDIDRLKKELAALREKYRWHKQSEDLAPETYEKVIWIREQEYDCGGIFEWDGSVCCGKCVPFDCYWRPLDLPEEGNK